MSDLEIKSESCDFDVDIGLLIRLVQNFQYLFNKELPEFKNISLRERTWTKIAATLKVPVEDCQRVWKNLRDKYGKEKRLIQQSPNYISKWEFYDSMHFLRPFIKRRRRTRRLPASYRLQPTKFEYKEESADDVSNSSHIEKKIWDPIEMTFSPKDIEMIENESEESGEVEEITLETDLTDELPIKQIDEPNNTINIVRHHSSEEAFGAYVASRLMDFSLDDRQEKKVKIFKILENLDKIC